MRLLNYLPSLQNRRQHRAIRRPSSTGITLNLEALEERWLPNGTVTAASAAPPSFVQAAITLYFDGVRLEAVEQANFLAFLDDLPKAYAAENLALFLGNFDINSIKANIASNLPYACPFGPFLVLAGELAVDQFLNIHSPDSASSPPR